MTGSKDLQNDDKCVKSEQNVLHTFFLIFKKIKQTFTKCWNNRVKCIQTKLMKARASVQNRWHLLHLCVKTSIANHKDCYNASKTDYRSFMDSDPYYMILDGPCVKAVQPVGTTS